MTVLLTGCGEVGTGQAGHQSGTNSCAALVEYGGHPYEGSARPRREPQMTGRVETGTMPRCDDGGGAERARRIRVAELVGIPMSQALLVRSSVYVRAGRPLPEAARVWLRSPACATSSGFRLGGDWLGVEGPNRPRSDGDLRPPYAVTVRVTAGPRRYRSATLVLRATSYTRPTLGPRDVRTSLWDGGGLVARVRCDHARFVATALTSTPG